MNSVTKAVQAELIEEEGEKRYKITDIIGREESLGVENHKGSGGIGNYYCETGAQVKFSESVFFPCSVFGGLIGGFTV